jgi:phosphoglycerate dehydrogenase-like enzyme
MLIKVLEPLGIPQEDLEKTLREAVADNAEIVFYPDRKTDPATLIERAKDADAVVLSNFPFPAEVIEALPQLKYICVAFTGFDHVAMDQAAKQGIKVSNCSGYSNAAVAELVLGNTVALYRKLLECDQATRAGKSSAGLKGREIAGKCFGIIGLGAIGKQVAKLAQAFGAEVIAYNRSKVTMEGVRQVELDELMQEADIISVHLPSNAETKGLISREKIALMKPSAIFINAARGPIVDSKALADALNKDQIAGAAVDVFDQEPPLDMSEPLLGAKNCLLTPHVGFLTLEAMYKRADIVAANLKAYLDGQPINLVN